MALTVFLKLYCKYLWNFHKFRTSDARNLAIYKVMIGECELLFILFSLIKS